jgi:hypothetical protein
MMMAAAAAGPAFAQGRPPQRPAPQRPATPPILQQPLPPPVAAPAVQPRERRIALPEIGLAAGAPFGAEGRDILLPLPRDLPPVPARLALSLDLAAPFPARHAVEVRVNDRLLAARAFPEGGARLLVELPVPGEDLSRDADGLRLGLRLIGLPDVAGATATLRPESGLSLSLPDGYLPSVAAMMRLMPERVVVLTRPEGIRPAEAAAALRISLALAGSGRDVRIATGGVPGPTPGPGGARLWDTGTVVVGATAQATSVVELAGLPVLAIGGPDPDGAARLLEGPWRAATGATAIGTALAAIPPAAATSLPFSGLRGTLAAQEAARAAWSLSFSTRDLPPASWPAALDVDLRAPAGGAAALATVLLNDVVLGSATVPPDGRLRLDLPVPERLLALESRIAVTLHRAAAGAPAQLLPGSAIRLGAAPAPAEFLALPPALAAGFEVLVDAPGGVVTAEALAVPLWLLRGLAPGGAPITVTPVEPGSVPRPRGPFLAATREPPAGSAPPIRVEDGRIRMSGASGALELDGAAPILVVQLVESDGPRGLWVRAPSGQALPFPPPFAAPGLDRGDVALLDRGGVAQAWLARPAPAVLASPATPLDRSAVLRAWRPVAVGVFWAAGVALVVYAFMRPRRDAIA